MKKRSEDAKNSNLLEIIIEAIRSKKGESITLLDLTHLNTSICNSFIIAHAESTVQVRSIQDAVIDQVRENAGKKPYHAEGFENSQWILLDYGDIIVHIFQKPYRYFYNLEELWADGKRVDFES